MQNYLDLLARFSNKRVLIAGDVMLDSYWIGAVDRISPEAPVPIVRKESVSHRLGGAGNVALNVKTLGAEPVLCTVTGDDEAGRMIAQKMRDAGMSTQGIVTSKKRKTTIKTRILASGQQLLRVDEEATDDLSKDESKIFLERAVQIIENQSVDVLLLQDYDKGVLSEEVIRTLIGAASAKDIPVVVDPKRRHFFLFEGVSLFKPNLKEVGDALGEVPAIDEQSLSETCAVLRKRLSCDNILLTLSEHGIFASSPGGHFLMPTDAKQVADVSGAGDTVISVAALGMAAGGSMKEITALANRAAGIVCMKPGVVPISAEELKTKKMSALDQKY